MIYYNVLSSYTNIPAASPTALPFTRAHAAQQNPDDEMNDEVYGSVMRSLWSEIINLSLGQGSNLKLPCSKKERTELAVAGVVFRISLDISWLLTVQLGCTDLHVFTT